MRRVVAVMVGALAVASVLAVRSGPADRAGRHPPATARADGSRAPSTATTSTVPTTATSRPTTAPAPRCTPDPSLGQPAQPAPADLAAALDRLVASTGPSTSALGVSVWMDGYGEVLVHEPDRLLVPASNQKLLTAIGALDALGPDVRLITRVVLGPGGNLVVVGGGDATVRREGPHSLATLADQVRRSGVTSAPRLLVDEARYDGARRASGWQDWQVPTYTGPLSALVVDDNRWRGDAAYLADPALANAEALRAALVARGVSVGAPAAYGSAGGRDTPVASLSSPTVLELVGSMLTDSDNEIADALLREVGAVRAGSGSMAAGAAVTARTVAGLCVSPAGHTDDGSGLSRANARSARAWRTVLQAARAAPWFPSLYDALPVAARTGTLASRLHGTAAEANVRAKTGTLLDGAALAGYATSAGGRPVVFSVVVNGPSPGTATAAIDRFVAALVAHPG